jgi:hypothetical protein
VRLPRPGLTELVHVLSHGASQQGAKAVVAVRDVADRREDGKLVSLVATHGAGQAQVEEFGKQQAIAIGRDGA